MGIRKAQINRMVKAYREHETLAGAHGWKANPDTDKARKDFEDAKNSATPEERELFKRMYE